MAKKNPYSQPDVLRRTELFPQFNKCVSDINHVPEQAVRDKFCKNMNLPVTRTCWNFDDEILNVEVAQDKESSFAVKQYTYQQVADGMGWKSFKFDPKNPMYICPVHFTEQENEARFNSKKSTK